MQLAVSCCGVPMPRAGFSGPVSRFHASGEARGAGVVARRRVSDSASSRGTACFKDSVGTSRRFLHEALSRISVLAKPC
jgi:hypothetical protein